MHPLPNPIPNNAIRIVDLNGTTWWGELEETLGSDDMGTLHSDVQDAWNNMQMAPVLLRRGNMSMQEGLLVCHFLELAVRRGTYLARSVAAGTTRFCQMVWLDYCVRYVGSRWKATRQPFWGSRPPK